MPGKESICLILPMPAIIIASVLYRESLCPASRRLFRADDPGFAGALSAIADPGGLELKQTLYTSTH